MKIVMNFFNAINTYTDLFYQVPRLWNSALNQDSPEALSEINRMMDRILNKIVTNLGTGRFYRARIVSPKDYDKIQLKSEIVLGSEESGIKGFCSNEMGPPPSEHVEDGRANKAKSSFLYLASDRATACSEVQPVCGDLISVAPFELTQTVQIADLRNIPHDLGCFTNNDNPDKLVDIVFTTVLINFFSTPVGQKNAKEFYKYSQYASEYLLKQGISGLMYNSSHNSNSGSYNLVLFNSSIAKCVVEYAEMIICLSVAASFQNISKNSFGNKPPEIVEAKKEIPSYNWTSTALLQRDLLNLKEKACDHT